LGSDRNCRGGAGRCAVAANRRPGGIARRNAANCYLQVVTLARDDSGVPEFSLDDLKLLRFLLLALQPLLRRKAQ